jgi:hypothetical protein
MAGKLDTKEEIKDQSIDEIRVIKIFSPETPSEIVEKLKTILLHYDVVPLLDADAWKLTYTIKSELDSERIEPEFCEVWVEILKITDFLKEVKFTKIAGSTYHFDE